MSVISVKRRWQERDADDEKTVLSWLITTDNPDDDPIAFVGALQASGDLPYRGSPHPLNPFLLSRGPKLKSYNGSPLHYICESEYKIPAPTEREKESEQRQDNPNPINRDPVITRTFEKVDRAIHKDREGNAILNSAGDPFVEPVVKQKTFSVWNISVNLTEDPPWMDTLADKVNENQITIRGRSYEAGQALFEPGEVSDERTEAGQDYFRVSCRILIDLDGHKERRYDNGYRKKQGDDRIRITVEDDQGELTYPNDPVLLDGEGDVLANPTPENAVELEFEIFEEGDFSQIPGVD